MLRGRATVDAVANNVSRVSFEIPGVVGNQPSVTIDRNTVVTAERKLVYSSSAYPPESQLRGEMPIGSQCP